MKKMIYYSKDIRCKVSYIKYLGLYRLQIQERRFFIFWVDVYRWMTVKEGFWGESERHPILTGSYHLGNSYEVWMTGTLDIKKRVFEFLNEYLSEKGKQMKSIERVKNFMNQ